MHWILNLEQSDTFVGLSFCPTQIREHSSLSRPPHDALPWAFCFLFNCLRNLLKGPPRRILFFLGSAFISGVDVLLLVDLLSGFNVFVVGEFLEAEDEQ